MDGLTRTCLRLLTKFVNTVQAQFIERGNTWECPICYEDIHRTEAEDGAEAMKVIQHRNCPWAEARETLDNISYTTIQW